MSPPRAYVTISVARRDAAMLQICTESVNGWFTIGSSPGGS